MKASSVCTMIRYRIKECKLCNPQNLRNYFDKIMYEKSFAATVDAVPLIIMSTCVQHDVVVVSGFRKRFSQAAPILPSLSLV